jgi:hypothetical protein
LQQALDALERGIEFVPAGYGIERQQWETIEAIRAHLAKPEPKPVAWMWEFEHAGASFSTKEPTMSIRDGVNYFPIYRKE